MVFSNVSSVGPGRHNLVIGGVTLTTAAWQSLFFELLFILIIVGIAAIIIAYRHVPKASSRQQDKQPAVVNHNKEAVPSAYIPQTLATKFNYGVLFKQQCYFLLKSASPIAVVGLLIAWVVAFIVPATVAMPYLLPLVFLMGLTIFVNLGSVIRTPGMEDWLATIFKAQSHIRIITSICGCLFAIILVLPFVSKQPQTAGVLVVFGIVVALFSQLTNTWTKNPRLLTVSSILFWFIYVNGVTVLLPVDQANNIASLIYGLLALMLLALLYLPQVFNQRRTARS
ncbi:hypothetical protein JCM14202_2258 [Agrilactobacillus composti DSM 18527 = JCM 14202]|nr:hypothetical protein [Agrilactobacillus composti]GAF40362.1 hypothetical protein JCM14202_2258 [Agrilactobacillus composti DSM 18527 = JCM 14202]